MSMRIAPVHPVVLTLAVSCLLVLVYNDQLWSAIFTWWPGRSLHDILFLGSVALFLTVLFNLILQPVAMPRLLKPVLILVVFTAAGVSYFASSYGAMMDKTMIANVLETDAREVGDLVNIRLFVNLALFGLLPAIVLCLVPLSRLSWKREAVIRGGVVLASFAMVGLTAAFFYQDYASLIRNHREMRFMINPSAAIYATMRYATDVPSAMASGFEQVAETVTRAPVAESEKKKTVLVFVVGETARADHFSLNGYGRDTNPQLSKLDIVNFGNVRSCGTSTAESVPCMFSDLARDDYSSSGAGGRENLLDILVRAGVNVLWLENNSSCKGVCARVPTEIMWNSGDGTLCNGSECDDEILLKRLRAVLEETSKDTIVVLHQIGSHGPSYFKRYPPAFGVFSPTCDTNQLQSCTQTEIVNTYDDSILYTDHILAETIDILTKASDRFDTAMLYVSDHGESLGENGMYLHGMPYMFAPDTQKHVPMVAWASEGYARKMSLDMRCLRAEEGNAYSHDNLFHSVLGMFGVETGVYRSALDIAAPCRRGLAVVGVADPASAETGRP
ncbi:MAG: phosphoethanolamine--lipid A transferase [Parvibaculum sp.]|nr:phosphoethanolamine--lipid A transferase [Parvibaculum sp.]